MKCEMRNAKHKNAKRRKGNTKIEIQMRKGQVHMESANEMQSCVIFFDKLTNNQKTFIRNF